MRTRQRFGPVVLGVVVALLLGEAGQADAGFMVSLDAGSPTGTGPFTFDYAGTSNTASDVHACSITSGDQVTVTGAANTLTVNVGLFTVTVPLSDSVTVTEA